MLHLLPLADAGAMFLGRDPGSAPNVRTAGGPSANPVAPGAATRAERLSDGLRPPAGQHPERRSERQNTRGDHDERRE